MGYTPPPRPPLVSGPIPCEYCNAFERTSSGLSCANCGAPRPPLQPIVFEPSIVTKRSTLNPGTR